MGLLGGLGKVLGTVGSIGSFIPGPWQPFAKGAAVLGGALSGAESGGKADKLQQQRTAQANQRYAELAPFRSKLAALAKRPALQREDTSALFADPGNPYSRSIPRPSPLASLPAPTSATPIALKPGLFGNGGINVTGIRQALQRRSPLAGGGGTQAPVANGLDRARGDFT